MQYEDRVTIATPEGVDVDLPLAGIGSRFIAALIDTAIKLIVLLGFFIFLFGGASLLGGGELTSLGAAAYYVVVFLILFGYDVFFETLLSGRTPGKKWTGLRVVRIGGRPVGFVASSIRNIVRIVDFLPSLYLVGMITAIATRMNQRLGDLAAGTVVVRERAVAVVPPPLAQAAPTHIPPELESWDVSAITMDDLATIRRFLERRAELAPHARGHLAHELADRLQGKVVGAPPMPAEVFLELVSVAKGRRA
ncbi:MAG: RDD family protein [Actinobacteria bacterium]|nr:RDD family protein [Actinomycetota bacterium]